MARSTFQYSNYRGVADLDRAMRDLATRVPRETRVVVGIPRSGILAASLLALHLNRPLTDLDGFLDGRVLASGRRMEGDSLGVGAADLAVIVDDSVLTGTALRAARAAIAASKPDANVVYAAPFVTGEGVGAVDFYSEVVERPRIFAWNLLHHAALLGRACIDIDGVLCVDPSDEENDEGMRYEQFLSTARPLFVPSVPVACVVTARLEKYREQTEQWLRSIGLQYGQLVMLELEDASIRRRTRAHSAHKAHYYSASGLDLFIESSYRQAVEIAARSGRQVFAVDRSEMVYPSPRQALRGAPLELTRSVASLPPALALYRRARRAAANVGVLQLVRRARP